jgi:hypothetical protein
LAEKRSAIDEIAIVKVFVAKLDHADTGGNERGGDSFELGWRRSAIEQDTERYAIE